MIAVDTPTRMGIKSEGLLLTTAAPSTAPSEATRAVVTVGGGVAEGAMVIVGDGVEVCVGVIVDPGGGCTFFAVGVGVFGLGVGVGTPPTERIEV